MKTRGTLREEFEKEHKHISKREFPMFLSVKYIQWLEEKVRESRRSK